MVLKDNSGFYEKLVRIRRDLHAHPELAFQEFRTSGLVARQLEELGYSVNAGIARTGVVATLQNGTGRKSIGIRADMDALPIQEDTGLAYSSRIAGKMHACGHDGHTTMLLGAAEQIASRRAFDGTVHLIFQPAEEDIGGARAMIEDGLFDKHPCDAVFALHNFPGFAEGEVIVREGAFMAGIDFATVTVNGVGGHGAMPHLTVDPVLVGSQIVVALQSVVSRNTDPLEGVVITVGAFNAGKTCAIIPAAATLEIGIRSFSNDISDDLEKRICKLIRAQADSFGAHAEIDYQRSYPATINSSEETRFVRKVAAACEGVSKVRDLEKPFCVSEDFSYMLQEKNGCYFGLGMGDEPGRPNLHDPRFDFNDNCIPAGVTMWTDLVERYLPS